jgi:lipooligosaccharide transport system ATP-binding protein
LEYIIDTKSLTKKFGDRLIVDQVQLQVKRGECFGILGPNGAGKSTTMQMLYGSLMVSSGEAYVLGINVQSHRRELRARVGVVPQEDGLDPDFNVRENLLLYAGYHGIEGSVAQSRADELLRLMRLEDHSEKSMDELSGGMRRRLSLARGMLNHPEVLFLDEPTSGLDPQARLWIWDFLEKIKSDMGTVMLTTHYMEEAEAVCDRVAIMDNARILTVGTPKELIKLHIGREVVEVDASEEELKYYRNRLSGLGYQIYSLPRKMNIYLQDFQDNRAVLNAVQGTKVTLRPPTLNDVFLKLAGHELRQDIQ